MVDNNLPKLSQYLLEIVKDDNHYDMTIEVGRDPNTKIFRSHIIILFHHSPYFRRLSLANKRKIDGTLVVHIKLPNILPDIFQIILRYIYGEKLSLDTFHTLDIIKILEVAKDLKVQEFITYLQDYLIENVAIWMQNFNFMNPTNFDPEPDSFSKLQRFCTDLISKEPERIFKARNFVTIPERSLIYVIQNDQLQMTEVQIWEHVLRWGLAQNPGLPSNPSDYSKENLNALKNTLRQCIPFIRFYNLTPKEFSDKVLPYKELLPKELREELIKRSMDPNNKQSDSRTRGVKSKIITNKHVEMISKWINKEDDYERTSTSYEFKLICTSRDGISPKLFHQSCDNKSHTISIIKVKNTNEIIGGYNPIEWRSESNNKYRYGTTKDSFIFSFKDFNNYTLSRVKNERKAIDNCASFGPSFGRHDLAIFDTFTGFCIAWDYKKHIRDDVEEFSVEEYEIFQIIRT